MKKYRYAPIVGALAVVAITEAILRLGFGFCDALLYQSSDRYEYIAQPPGETPVWSKAEDELVFTTE